MPSKQLLNKINKVEIEREKLKDRLMEVQQKISEKDDYLKKLYELKKKEEKLEEQQKALDEEINAM